MLGYSVKTLGGASGTASGTACSTGKIVEIFSFLTGLYSRPVRMSAEDDAALTEVSEWLLAYRWLPQEYYLKFGKYLFQ